MSLSDAKTKAGRILAGMMVAPLAFLIALALVLAFARVTAHARPQCANASWYGYTGAKTANGERYDGSGMTAAHRSLPFGSGVRVTIWGTARPSLCGSMTVALSCGAG